MNIKEAVFKAFGKRLGQMIYDTIRGNQVYEAILNQSGTDAPTVVSVCKNTLDGGDPVFSYVGVGSYEVSHPSIDSTSIITINPGE